MKNTSQQIYNLLVNDVLNKALENLANGSLDPVKNEMSLKEAIEKYYYMRDVLIEVSQKELLDNLPFAYRNALNSSLSNLFSNRTNAANALAYIESLNNQFYSYRIESLLKGINFSKDLQEALRERQEYRKISNTLRKGLKWAEEIEDKYSAINEIEEQSKDSSERIESNRKLISEAKDKILEIQKDVDSKKIVIDNTFEAADDTRSILKNSEKEAQSIESKFKLSFENFVSNAKGKNENLQKENINIQREVNKLLQGAVAGKLHEGFITRKKELEKTLNVWLSGIIILNVFILIFSFTLIYGITKINIGPLLPVNDTYLDIKGGVYFLVLASFLFFLIKKYLFSQNKYVLRAPQLIIVFTFSVFAIFIFFEGLEIPKINKIDFGVSNYWSPLIKLLITVPLIVLDWFLIKEYSYRKDFVEKYTFKSAISLSLLTYRDLIKQEKNPEAVKFINNAIDKIYKDPFENDKYSLAKKEKDLLSSFVDNLSGKILKSGND